MLTICVSREKALSGGPDVCRVPSLPPPPDRQSPYPNATIISVGKKESVRKVYSVKSGEVRELPIRGVTNAPTFIILDDGSVSVYEHECRTLDAAKRAVAGDIGTNASATVISIDEDEKSPLAFRVTQRSVYSLRIEIEPESRGYTDRE